MEEISAMHELTLEWGCITNLMDKISALEDSISGGWPELVDMVADAVCEEGENKDTASVFFSLYQFLWRLYYRIKAKPERAPFNKYSKVGDKYWVENYSYNVFKWARKIGATMEIDNLVIKIPIDKLTESQRRALDRRCQ